MPAIYALYVINKSGGLIYNKVRDVCACTFSERRLCTISYCFSLPAGVPEHSQQ